MLELEVSIRDLGLFFLFAAGLVALVYLIIVLKKVSDLLKNTQKIIEEHEGAIRELMEHAPLIAQNTADISERIMSSVHKTEEILPQILGNVEDISGSINNSIRSIDASISSVGSGIDHTVAAVQDSASDMNTYLNILLEALGFLAGLFAQSKKKKKRK